ncbi:MAG: hypothetical protein R2705_01360 [Ilumatobacteraceae bacterium]
MVDHSPVAGEILVRTATSSLCGPLSVPGIAGCGGPRTVAGLIVSGEVSLATAVPCRSNGGAIAAHELGHAFGLSHYTGTVGGLRQLMYPTTESKAPTFRAGDRAGLRTLAGTLQLEVSAALGPPNADQLLTSYFSPSAAGRVLDTRSGLGLAEAFAAGTSRTLNLSGALGSAQLDAVVLNLTATGTQGAGYVVAHAQGTAVPDTSVLNFVGGRDAANFAIVELGPGNTITLGVEDGSADLVADVLGTFSADGPGGFVPMTPTRLFDTRRSDIPGERGFPLGCSDAALSDPTVLAAAGIDLSSALGEIVNVTATDTSNSGYVSLLDGAGGPADGEPATSVLNVVGGETRANLSITPSAQWWIQLGPSLTGDVIVDATGWFAPLADRPDGAGFLAVDPQRRGHPGRDRGLPGILAAGTEYSVPMPLPAGVSAADRCGRCEPHRGRPVR